MPPVLLDRARSIASQHQQLTETLAGGFDARAAKRVGEYGPVVRALQEWDHANEVGTPNSPCPAVVEAGVDGTSL